MLAKHALTASRMCCIPIGPLGVDWERWECAWLTFMAAQQQLQGMRAQIPERAGPPEGPGYI
jgi:hypothetical protein